MGAACAGPRGVGPRGGDGAGERERAPGRGEEGGAARAGPGFRLRLPFGVRHPGEELVSVSVHFIDSGSLGLIFFLS